MKISKILLFGLVTMVALAGGGTPARADRFEDALLDYRRGEYGESFASFEKLAKQGDARAQFWIGTMWYHGRGKPQNFKEAYRWYLRSAYLGNADGQSNLGLIYRNGDGQQINPVVAYAWFSLAASQNNEVARRNLEDLAEELRVKKLDSKILEGQALAQEYLARIEIEKQNQRAAVVMSQAGTPPQTVTLQTSRTQPVALTAPAPRRNLADTQEVYMVQVGLFENQSNIGRIRRTLATHHLQAEDQTVEIRGRNYQRFRLGPFTSYQDGEAMARRIDKIFKVQSAVIPLFR